MINVHLSLIALANALPATATDGKAHALGCVQFI